MSNSQKRSDSWSDVERKSKRRKDRSYYKKQSTITSLTPNISGIFASCTKSKEALCVRECYDLFNAYAEKLYEPKDSNSALSNSDVEDEDIENSIAKELAQMRQPHTSHRFASIQTGTDCVVFVKTDPSINPVHLVHHILTDLNNSGQKKTRFCKRLIPITKTCYANMNDIEKLSEEVIKPHFYTQDRDQQQKIKYAVVPNIRNNQTVERMELITLIARVVGNYHVVNLDEPDLVIIVEVFKSICGMSVLSDYKKLKRYNVESIFEGKSKDNIAQEHKLNEETGLTEENNGPQILISLRLG
ncbi:6063_t:CDS:2 [Acaulospora morrowiae]|uniref:6063_t:CDS:1 n=1 Tax=Acaulospora morrowiae TaxID=94023 RepID=A0A9N9D8L3_9GLOM|nr:6063_t:CDS:2 [Acaulospora morrowiae]